METVEVEVKRSKKTIMRLLRLLDITGKLKTYLTTGVPHGLQNRPRPACQVCRVRFLGGPAINVDMIVFLGCRKTSGITLFLHLDRVDYC